MDIAAYLRDSPKINLRVSGAGRNWRGPCPLHGGTNPTDFSINATTGAWLCRARSCGKKGSFPLLYKLLEGLASWEDVNKRLGKSAPWAGKWDDLLALATPKLEGSHLEDVLRQWPSEAYQIPVTREFCPAYLTATRGFPATVADLGFDLRVCTAGPFCGRVLLPYYDANGTFVGFTGRAMGDASPRYKFPAGFEAGAALYGAWRLAWAGLLPRIWVVEGQFDVISLAIHGAFAVALSTHKATSWQMLEIRRLSRLYQAEICICLDRGAEDKSQQLAGELGALGVPVTFAWVSQFAKDPGELTTSTYKSLVDSINSTTTSFFC